ncbi:protocadherin-16 [Ixodes scapularis]
MRRPQNSPEESSVMSLPSPPVPMGSSASDVISRAKAIQPGAAADGGLGEKSRRRARDNLCYLTHGGSSETFTVNEAFPVESIIGTLQVAGNASETYGDIELRMADPEKAPLSILPGTKDLVLRQKLDKEGEDGLRSVTTDVICAPRHTRDNDHLSITVPVRIIVTDANDNAPEFQGTPYFLNVSEITVPGTTVMQGIRAVDKDQPGPFSTVEYYVEDGPYSHLLTFESRLEGSLVLKDRLDYETVPRFTVTLRAQDQGNPPQSSHTTLVVVVHDADDQNPRFLAERYFVHLHENPRLGVPLDVKPSKIQAEDPDEEIRAPIKYTFNSAISACMQCCGPRRIVAGSAGAKLGNRCVFQRARSRIALACSSAHEEQGEPPPPARYADVFARLLSEAAQGLTFLRQEGTVSAASTLREDLSARVRA